MTPNTQIAAIAAEARAAKASAELRNYSSFGRRHGGSDRLYSMLIGAKAVALVGAMALATILTSCFHIAGIPALTIVVVWLGFVALFDLVVCALFLRPRRFLRLMTFLVLWLAAGSLVIGGLYGLTQI